jgi:hydantoinase/carbamoylase family amidase
MLDLRDAEGVTLAEALRCVGSDPEHIASLARSPAELAGYIEVHIEQGPVLLNADIPVGVVDAIAGSVRLAVTISGVAGHAGTVPMQLRQDAAAAAAELLLFVERRCGGVEGLMGTVGQLNVPNGAGNVVPGRCELTVDIRAPQDRIRDAAVSDVLVEAQAIAKRRRVEIGARELARIPAVPCSMRIRDCLGGAITSLGFPVHTLTSGAGHDAMVLARITDVGMLFVRCGNGGISHNPRETIASADAEVAACTLLAAIQDLAECEI